MRTGLLFGLICLLAACQTGGGPVTPGPDSPLAGEAIETTTLDDPVVGLAEEQAEANPEPIAEEAEGPATEDTPPAEAAEGETPPEPEEGETPPEAAVVEEPEVIDPALLTPEARACQRRGGIWTKIGAGNARSCVKATRDAGKQCDADRDCQGVCLARSGTCAPVDPLFGCNDVLQDDGRRMTLCLN
jgi:hypothetical protein